MPTTTLEMFTRWVGNRARRCVEESQLAQSFASSSLIIKTIFSPGAKPSFLGNCFRSWWGAIAPRSHCCLEPEFGSGGRRLPNGSYSLDHSRSRLRLPRLRPCGTDSRPKPAELLALADLSDCRTGLLKPTIFGGISVLGAHHGSLKQAFSFIHRSRWEIPRRTMNSVSEGAWSQKRSILTPYSRLAVPP
jgi:hypothetical protein